MTDDFQYRLSSRMLCLMPISIAYDPQRVTNVNFWTVGNRLRSAADRSSMQIADEHAAEQVPVTSRHVVWMFTYWEHCTSR